MQVILAQPRGFCAGVERAIAIVEMALEKFGAPVYVRHEIVHNPHVVQRLRDKGAVFVEEIDEIPEGAATIFSAHGVSEAIEMDATHRGLDIIDATCPLVEKVHKEGQRYAKQGYEIILIGHDGHPEVEGTLGRVPGRVKLISEVEDVASLQVTDPEKLAYITQTTLSLDDTRDVIEALKKRFPNIKGPSAQNDICYATQNRQEAVRELSKHVDVVLVIGAHNSSNSNRLQECAEEEGIPAYLIEDASHMKIEWVKGKGRVGITAGASAPEDLVQDLIEKLGTIEPVTVSLLPGKEENVHFRLPVKLTKAEPRVGTGSAA
jgi:4-hydroxy-3-methylbut-2-en-1-yl diphosphate reductase